MCWVTANLTYVLVDLVVVTYQEIHHHFHVFCLRGARMTDNTATGSENGEWLCYCFLFKIDQSKCCRDRDTSIKMDNENALRFLIASVCSHFYRMLFDKRA